MNKLKQREFIMLIAYGLYTMLGGSGSLSDLSPKIESFSSFLDSILKSDNDPIRTIVFGVLIGIYMWVRTKRKNQKTVAEYKLKELENEIQKRIQISAGGRRDISNSD